MFRVGRSCTDKFTSHGTPGPRHSRDDLGPLIGTVLGELFARGGIAKAGKVGVDTWLDLITVASKVFLAFMMIAALLIAYLF